MAVPIVLLAITRAAVEELAGLVVVVRKGVERTEKVFIACTVGIGTTIFSVEILVVTLRPSELETCRMDDPIPLSDQVGDPEIDVHSFWVWW